MLKIKLVKIKQIFMEARNSLTSSSWTLDIEIVCDQIRKNCLILTEFHRERYLVLNGFIKWFRIPIIVVSAINSVFSVGLNKFIKQDAVSVINCLMSLIVGVIGSIELYLAIQDKLNKELASSKNYYILSADIYKMLSLDRKNRHSEALMFLDEHYNQYIKLINASNIREQYITDNLTKITIKENEPVEVSLDIPTRPFENFENF